jgi:hypothetical protein
VSFQLQSFVVAAIVAAILFADYAGGREEVARRLYQVTTGFALAFAVLAATTAFLPLPEGPDLSSIAVIGEYGTGDLAPSTDRVKEIAAVHAAIAIALVLLGLAGTRRVATVGLAAALGGLLLLLASGDGSEAASALNSITSIFGSGESDQARDIAYFAVLAVGSLLLLLYGYKRWDAPGETATEAA